MKTFAIEGDGIEIFNGTLNVTLDVDTTDTHTFQQVGTASISSSDIDISNITNFSVIVASNGQYTVSGNFDALAEGETATVTFDYTATDDSGALNAVSDPKTVTLTITGTNDQSVVLNVDEGSLDETFDSSDVIGVDDTKEDINTVFTSTLTSVSDDDINDTHTYQLVEGTIKVDGIVNENVNVVINANGEYTVSGDFNYLAKGENATVTFEYTASDNSSGAVESNVSEAKLVTLVINGTNDQPIVLDVDAGQIDESHDDTDVPNVDDTKEDVNTVFVSTLNTVSDDDTSDAHTYELVDGSIKVDGNLSESVSVVVNGNGQYTITGDFNYLAKGESATVTFEYTASDNSSGSEESNKSEAKTVTLVINGTNDQPIIEDLTFGTLPLRLLVEEPFEDGPILNQVEGPGLIFETHDSTDIPNVDDTKEDVNTIFTATLNTVVDDNLSDTHTYQVVEGTETGLADATNADISIYALDSEGAVTTNQNEIDHWEFKLEGDFNYLAAGQTETITFQYTATDNSIGNEENNVSEPKTISITLTGTNDQPVVSDVNAGEIDESHDSTDIPNVDDTKEDVNTVFTSTLDTVTDEDVNDTHTYQLVASSVKLDDVLSEDVTVIVNSNGDYSISGDFNYLAKGESATVTFEYTASDNSIGSEESNVSEPKTVTLVINGTNDQPVVEDLEFGGLPQQVPQNDLPEEELFFTQLLNEGLIYETHDSTDVPNVDDTKEDVNTIFTQTLNTVSDDDTNDTHTYQVVSNSVSGLENATNGSVSIYAVDDEGSETTNPSEIDHWEFKVEGDFNYLAAGETVTVSFLYTATDDSSGSEENNVSEPKNISVTITGTNDQPVVSDVDAGEIDESHDSTDVLGVDDTKEDVNTVFTSTLDTVMDDDVNDTHTYQLVSNSIKVDGILSENVTVVVNSNGDYSISGDFNYLAKGESATVTFQYTASDNSVGSEESNVSEPKTVTLVINGTNDQPVVEDLAFGGESTDEVIFDTLSDTDDGVGFFDDDNINYFAQTFTALETDINTLDFGFHPFSSGADDTFHVLIAKVNDLTNGLEVGDIIYESGDLVINDIDSKDFSLNIDLSESLSIGEKYVVIFDSAVVYDAGGSTRYIKADSENPDLDNTLYFLPTGDRSDIFTSPWFEATNLPGYDFGLRISYNSEMPIYETHDDTDVANVDDTKEDVTTVFSSELNTVTDDDVNDTHTYQVVTNSVSGLENATNGSVSIYAVDDEGLETTNSSEIDHWEFKVEGDFNYLATGETVSVSFQYTATDDSSGSEENNVSEPKTISVTITGTNDQPVIEDITTSLAETVDSDIPQESQTSGQIDDVLTVKKGVLSVQDDDESDTHTFNIHGNVVVTSVVGGNTTIETFTDIQESPASIYLVPETQFDLQVVPSFWEYKVEGNFNYLGVGDTATVTFDYVANDNENDENGESSISEPKTITVLITGTNDRPTVDRIDGEDALVFEETIRGDLDPANDSPNDVFTSLGGTFRAMDEDLSDTHIFKIKNASLTNNYVEDYLENNATLETQSVVLENDTGDIIAISDDIDPNLIELETLELVSTPVSSVIDGKVVTTQDFNLVGDFNALGEGENVTLLVRYRADDQETPLENNKSAFGWVEITVDGTNDRPVVKDVFVGQGELVVGEFTGEIIDSNLTMIQGSGEIFDMGDDQMSVDYWTIYHGGGEFNVKTVLSDVDPHIRLFKVVDGEYIQVLQNDDGGPGLEAEIDINNLETGEYILAVSGFHFSKKDAEEGVNEFASTGEYNIIFESEYGIEFVEGASTDENYIYESANSPDETNTFMGQVYLHKDLDVNDTHTFEMRSFEESELQRGVRVFDLGDQEEMLVEVHSTSEGLGEISISSIIMLPSGEYTIIGNFSALAKDETATVKFKYVAIDDSGVGENPITHDESDTSREKVVEVTFTGTNDRPQISNVNIEVDEVINGNNIIESQLTAHDDDVTNRDDITFEQIDYDAIINSSSMGVFALGLNTYKLESSDVDVRDFADLIDSISISSTGELYVEGDFNPLAKDEVIYLKIQYKADDNEGLSKTDIDEKSLSKTKEISIKVTGTNDAPILSEVTEGILEFTENDPALILDGRVEISDVDDTMMESATVTISSNYEAGVDMLLVTMQAAALPSSITRVEFLNGTLFIEGSATLSEYEEILESVAFINESEDPSGLPRTITWQVSDGDDSSNIEGTIVDVIPVNDAPIARNNQNSVKEEGVGSPAAANLTGNVILDANLNNGNIDSDVDNDISELSVTKIKSLNTNASDSSTTNDEYEVNGEYGVLTVHVDGTYSYDLRDDWNTTKQLNEGEVVTEEFRYTITDNALDENNNDVSLKDSAKLIITITGTNDKPVLEAIDSPAALVDTAVYDTFSDISGQLSGSDDDANTTLTYKVMGTDIDNLSATMTVEGTYGTLVLYTTTGEYIYTPNAQAINALQDDARDEFMFKVNDGLIDSDPQTLTINITGVNDTPVITTNSYSATFIEAVTDNQGITTGGAAVAIVDSSFAISDVDDVNMEGAVIEIDNAKADDLLSVMGSLPSGISIDLSSTATMIILTGTASKADYELAIESIKFSNSSHTPDETPRTINISVSDGDIDSAVKTSTINVQAQNDAPTAIDDNPIQNGTVLVSEDFENGNTGWSINTFELNWDDTGDTGIFMGRFGGTGGNEAVSKSFDFGVENAGKTVIIEFDMYEIDSWDADNFFGDNGVTEAFQVFINNTLHSSDPMATDFLPAWDADNALDGGTQTQNNIGFGWQDEIHHYNIPVTLDASGQVTLGFGTTLQQFILDESWGIDNLVITSGNDWTLNTEENSILEIDVLANDFDVDMDTLSISSHTYTAPSGGDSSVSIVNDKLEFDPGTDFDYLSAGEKHQISFDYTISDGNGAFDTATVIVDVLGTDDAPIATVHTDSLLDTNMKDDLSTSVDVVSDDRAADPNDLSETYSIMGNVGDSLAINPILGVDMGKLSAIINADGKTIDFSAGDAFDYLDDNETALVVINYGLYDGTSATPSTLEITITGTNDKPIIEDNQVFNIYENDALSHPDHEVPGGESNAYNPLENNLVDSFVGQVQASDAENDMLLYAITHVDGVSTTSIGYDPIFFIDEQTGDINLLQDVDYEDDQQYILTIRVTDGNSGFVTKDITVNIDALNDNVVIANDDSDMVLENEGKLIDVLVNDTDDDLLHNVLTLDSIDETTITLSWQDDGGTVIDTATWDALNNNLTLMYNSETITITNPFTIVDNKVQFTSATNGSSQFDFLANDEKLIISVDYKVKDNADSFGVQYEDIGTLTLTLDGTNDQPVITNEDVNISEIENNLLDSNTHGEQSRYVEVEGTLTHSDLDVTDDYRFRAFGDIEISGADGSGDFTIVNPTNGNSFVVNESELVLDVFDNGRFRVKSEAFNNLAEGEELSMSFQYFVTDREGFGPSGATPDEASWSDIKTATIKITGSNDQPVVEDINLNETTFWSLVAQGASRATIQDLVDRVITNSGSLPRDGSAIKYTIETGANETVEFNWDFLDAENDSFFWNDFSFVVIDGVLFTLEESTDTDVLGNTLLSHTFTDAGNHTIVFGVMNSVDRLFDSELIIEHLSGGIVRDIQTVGNANENSNAIVISESNGIETIYSGELGQLAILEDDDITDYHTYMKVGSESVTTSSIAVVSNFSVVVNADGSFDIIGNFDALAVGETATVTFDYKAIDDSQASNNESDAKTVTLVVTGTNDVPTVQVAASSGSILEGNTTSSLMASDTFSFADLDTTDSHTVSSSFKSGKYTDSSGAMDTNYSELGSMTSVVVSNVSTGDNAGEITWTYTVNDSAIQFLAKDETLEFVYTITVDDGNGGMEDKDVLVTITGTNDTPMISATAAADITEEVDASSQNISDSGTVSFFDIDTNDLIDVTYSPDNNIVWSGGTIDSSLASLLVAGFNTGISNAAVPGMTPWTYNVTGADLDFLAKDETITFSYTLTATDNNLASDTTTVSFEITGTNDAVVLASSVVSGDVSEELESNSEAPTLMATNTMAFTDLDLNDTHQVVVTQTPSEEASNLGSLSALISENNDGDGVGEVQWNYDVSNADVQYLAENQTKVETFTVTIADHTEEVLVGDLGAGVAARDGAFGMGYMMYFEDASDARFTKHPLGADNFVAVVYDGGVWKYDTNTSLAVFTPQAGDRLVAELDFSANTATMLFGETDPNNQINGIDAGYFNGDLAIIPELWNGSTSSPAPGEFGLTGSIINVATDDTTVSSQQISITITGTNDRPVISDYTEVTNINEDILTGSISLADVGLSDADTIDTHEFIALSGASTTVTDTNSVGIGTITVSMDVNGNYSFTGTGIEKLGLGESATVEFDVQVKDNSTASNDTSVAKTITVVIDGANDRPTLNIASISDFTNIVEDDGNDLTDNPGDLVSALLSSAMSDIDTNDEQGIAITSIDNSEGTWQYKLASGGSWINIPAFSASSAFLLGASDSVRFVPNEDQSGTYDITFKAWDQSTGTIAGMGDTTNVLNTQFSTNEATASISVEAVVANADYVITNDIDGSIDVDEFALIRNDSSSSGTISISPDPVTISSTGASNNDVTSHPSAYTLSGSNGDTDGGDVTVEIDTGSINGTSADEILVGRDANADTFVIDHDPGADSVLGGEVGGVPDDDSVQDNLVVNGSTGTDAYTITAGDFDGDSNIDGLNVNVNGDDVWVKDVEDLTINTNGGGDTITIIGDLSETGLASSTITINDDGSSTVDASGLTSDHKIVVNDASNASGGNGDDTIKGSSGADTLHGNGGDDKIYGQGGGGTFTGGDGDDKFYIQEDEVASSSIDGGADNDTVYVVEKPGSAPGVNANFASDSDLTNVEIVRGTNANDMLSLDGQTEDLRLIGANGDDNLEGGSGNDRIEGGNHNDMLDGNSGDDSVIAGSGDDTINVNSQEGFDTINGGSGIDKVKFGDISMSSGDSIDISAVGSKVRLEEDATNGFKASAIENLEVNTYAGDDVVEIDWDLVSKTSLSAGGNMIDAGENLGDNDILRLRMSSEEIATNQNTIVMMAMAISTGSMASGFDIDFKNFEQLQIADTTTGITYNIILGTPASDNPLNGTTGSEIIFAKESGDKVYGNNSADQLYGQDGNDSLHGEGGDDILRGGNNNDKLYGGMGADRLYGENGNDKLYVDQDDVDSGYVSGGSGSDTVYLVPTAGSGVTIKLNKNNVADDIETVNGTAYADTIEALKMQTKVTINAGDGDDIIRGGKGNDNLNGENGNDSIWGNDGKDVIKGGAGADKMYGQDNDDTFHVDQADVDGIMVGASLVKGHVDGGDGVDTIKLTETFDINIAQSSNVKNVEKVIGTNGDEIISAQHLTNPAKNIQTDLTYEGKGGNDQLLGGDGFDTAIYSSNFNLYSVTKNIDGSFTIEGPDGIDMIEHIEKLQFKDGFILTSDLMQALPLNVKTDLGNLATGSADIMIYDNGKDTLSGGNGADVIHAGSGDDKVYGNGSSDTLFGGDGKDTIEGGTGNDVIDGGAGNSDVALYAGNLEDYRLTRNTDGSIEVKDVKTAGGNEGTDTLTGIEKIKFADHTIEVSEINWIADEVATLVGDNDGENVSGKTVADTISVGNGTNTVNAGSGSDEVHGGSGKDKLYGEAGNDTLYGYGGKDTIEGGTGNDVIDGGAGNSDVALYAGNLEDYRLTRNTDGSIEVKDVKTAGGNEGTDTLTGIEKIKFADHTIEVSEINWIADEVATLVGDNDGENVSGKTVADTISVGNGANTVNAGSGSDEVHGGSGKDKLYGEAGNDQLFGYGGKDTLEGSTGNDTLDGGYGNDILLGGNNNDTIHFDKNDSTIDGGDGTDTLVFGVDDEVVGDLNISNVLANAISNFETIDLTDGDHILSGISTADVISMTDSDNILKIITDSGDSVKLDLNTVDSDPLNGEWKQTSSNNSSGFSTYESLTDSSVKLLIDENNVQDI